jgi:hypothetical protein
LLSSSLLARLIWKVLLFCSTLQWLVPTLASNSVHLGSLQRNLFRSTCANFSARLFQDLSFFGLCPGIVSRFNSVHFLPIWCFSRLIILLEFSLFLPLSLPGWRESCVLCLCLMTFDGTLYFQFIFLFCSSLLRSFVAIECRCESAQFWPYCLLLRFGTWPFECCVLVSIGSDLQWWRRFTVACSLWLTWTVGWRELFWNGLFQLSRAFQQLRLRLTRCEC